MTWGRWSIARCRLATPAGLIFMQVGKALAPFECMWMPIFWGPCRACHPSSGCSVTTWPYVRTVAGLSAVAAIVVCTAFAWSDGSLGNAAPFGMRRLGGAGLDVALAVVMPRMPMLPRSVSGRLLTALPVGAPWASGATPLQ